MPRAVWKGAISFGLVNIPVSLYPAARPHELDLDLLDRRDFSPVGYQRINKRTGKEIASEDMVKGYAYQKGQYVVLSEEDFRQANVKATQTVDIVAFVKAEEIAPFYFDTPYYLEPGKGGQKGYALLREALRKTGRVGLANVVLRTRQHLAAVIPLERMLLLNTLRFAHEIRPAKELELPPAGLKEAGVTAKEMEIALRLVEDMSEKFQAERYQDSYREDLLARIEAKVEAGRTHEVTAPGKEAPARGAQVIDLMAALKRSLEHKGPKQPAKRAAARRKRA